MGLPWVRLDTQFASNPKMLELTMRSRWRAAFVYVSALAYAGAHGTDGYLPETCLTFIHGTRKDADELVKAGLWRTDMGGWSINGWSEFQISDDAAKKRSDDARKAAMKRWHPDA